MGVLPIMLWQPPLPSSPCGSSGDGAFLCHSSADREQGELCSQPENGLLEVLSGVWQSKPTPNISSFKSALQHCFYFPARCITGLLLEPCHTQRVQRPLHGLDLHEQLLGVRGICAAERRSSSRPTQVIVGSCAPAV